MLVIGTYPSLDASRRLRIDPIIHEMRRQGIPVETWTIFSERAFRWKNRSGFRGAFAKGAVAIGIAARLFRIICMRKRAIVLIHREAFPFFTPHIERLVRRKSQYLVLDIDDNVSAQPTHGKDWRTRLRRPSGFTDVLSMVDTVLAGSPFMQAQAKACGTESRLCMTCPPEDYLALDPFRPRERQIIWIGSQSTLGNLEAVLSDVLDTCIRIDAKLLVLGGDNISSLPTNDRLEVRRWSEIEEANALRTASLGLMPLSHSEWDEGKSSYKALLYIAAGVPALISPVGMNEWLCQQTEAAIGVTDGNWSSAIERFFSDVHLRETARVGQAWGASHASMSKQTAATVKFLLEDMR